MADELDALAAEYANDDCSVCRGTGIAFGIEQCRCVQVLELVEDV